MTIENKGPGGVGNSYGTRETKNPRQLNNRNRKDQYTGRGDTPPTRSIVPWDTTSSELQKAHDAAIVENRSLDLAGATYNITTPVTLRTAAVTINANQATLDATNMSDTYAIRCDSVSADSIFGAKEHSINHLRLNGPTGLPSSSGIIGIWVNGTGANRSPRPTLNCVHIDGFGIAVDLGDYAYLTQFVNVESRGAAIGIRQSIGDDSGENTSWTGGAIYNHTEVAIQTLDESSELNFNSVSIDYGPRVLDHRAGRVTFSGGSHLENSGSQWVDDAIYLTGDGTRLNIFGGYLLSATTQATNLNQFITAADARSTVFADGMTIHNFGNTANRMGTGPGRIEFRNTQFYANGINVNPTRITDTYSKLIDGGFEASTFPRDYWSLLTDSGGTATSRVTGANGTLTQSTLTAFAGTKSLRVNKTATGALTFVLLVQLGDSCGPVTGQFRHAGFGGSPLTGAATNWDAGFTVFNGNDSNGIPTIPVFNSTASSSFTPTVGTWNNVNLRVSTNKPAWATHLYLRFTLPSANTGDFFIDDVSIHQW
jgi:hypothetical protein